MSTQKTSRFNCLKPESTNEKSDGYRRNNRFLKKDPLKENSRWKRDDTPSEQSDLPINSRWQLDSSSPKNSNSFKGTGEKNDRFAENNTHFNSFRKGNLGRRNYRNPRERRRYRDSNDGQRIQGRVIGQLDLGLALRQHSQKRAKSPDKNTKVDNKKKEVVSKKYLPLKKKNAEVYSVPGKDNELKKLILAQYALCSDESEDEQFLDTE